MEEQILCPTFGELCVEFRSKLKVAGDDKVDILQQLTTTAETVHCCLPSDATTKLINYD